MKIMKIDGNEKIMDQRVFVFATIGHCIKGKQWQHITIKNLNLC